MSTKMRIKRILLLLLFSLLLVSATACGSKQDTEPQVQTQQVEEEESSSPWKVIKIVIICFLAFSVFFFFLVNYGPAVLLTYFAASCKQTYKICKPKKKQIQKENALAELPCLDDPEEEYTPVGKYYDYEDVKDELNAYCTSHKVSVKEFVQSCGSLDEAVIKVRGY